VKSSDTMSKRTNINLLVSNIKPGAWPSCNWYFMWLLQIETRMQFDFPFVYVTLPFYETRCLSNVYIRLNSYTHPRLIYYSFE